MFTRIICYSQLSIINKKNETVVTDDQIKIY